MKIHFEENNKPLTKEQVDILTKIKMPKTKMMKYPRCVFKTNYTVWGKESKINEIR